MKLITFLFVFCGIICSTYAKENSLRFTPQNVTVKSLKMSNGDEVSYKAYEGIFYVTNVEDSTYQTLNLYVPIKYSGDNNTPIILRTYIGGYMASTAKGPSATDVTGRALMEGYVVCIPGSRGSNSVVTKWKSKKHTGTAPNGLLDLKAVVRYLHYNDDLIPGNSNLIFTDGTSAGGAMSALLGATGNHNGYDALLKKMGAAPACDDVFASICYCPITDLEHADMEYEWLYGAIADNLRPLGNDAKTISSELANLCPDYINSLNLSTPDGKKLTSDNYKEYIKKLLLASAHKALQEGMEISDTIGISFFKETPMFTATGRDQRGEKRSAPSFGPGNRPMFNRRTDFVADMDLDRYLSYVASVQALKNVPSFDAMGVAGGKASPENKVFGNADGVSSNFTTFSLRIQTNNPKSELDKNLQQRVFLMNPMNFIKENSGSTIALHWFIRHGAKDRDTSFLVPINLATKLQNIGANVDFFLPWNRPHSGDYNLDELVSWIKNTVSNKH